MKKLTKREKILLFVTAAVAVIALSIQFAIIPMYNAYTEKVENQEMLTNRKNDLEAKFAREPLIIREHNRMLDLFAELGHIYPANVPNEYIDRLVTGLIVSNGFTPMSLQIGGATSLTISNADIEVSAEEEDRGERTMSALTTMREAVSDSPPPPPPSESTRPAFLIVPVNMGIQGDYFSLKRLIAEINRTEHIRLTRFSYAIGNSADWNQMTALSVVISLEITMLNDNLEF